MPLLAMSGSPARHLAGRHPVAVGLVGAAIAVFLLLAWRGFERWYIFGSAFTDLPGQDSLALVNKLQVPVVAVIALVVGWLAGRFCPVRAWVATVIGVSPLLLLMLALFTGFGKPLDAAAWCIGICLLGLLGAYAPSWLSSRRTDARVRGQADGAV